jgi:DegV family protein with EDD domain
VTDGACDLPVRLLVEHNVDVVPVELHFGDDGPGGILGITSEEFWCRVRTDAAVPTTSAPSPGAFARAFLRARDQGFAGVCCVTASSTLAANFQSASEAAGEVQGDIAVRVVDSRRATLAEGLVVMSGVEAVEAGLGLDEVYETVTRLAATFEILVALDTLDFIRRSNRIGASQALFESLFAIKPVLTLRDGTVENESHQRTRALSLRYLADSVAAALPIRRLAVAHADARDIDAFLAMLRPVFSADRTIVNCMGPALGSHIGPGAIAVCFQRLQHDFHTEELFAKD